MLHSSSGPGHQILSLRIEGSNPSCSTKKEAIASFFLFSPISYNKHRISYIAGGEALATSVVSCIFVRVFVRESIISPEITCQNQFANYRKNIFPITIKSALL